MEPVLFTETFPGIIEPILYTETYPENWNLPVH